MVHSFFLICDMGRCLCARFSAYTFFIFFRRYKAISTNNSKDLLVNEEIKVAEVRVIGAENEQLGVMKIDDARTYAYNHGVDLVLIVPNATPPVCRAIDYGKFCFERDKREKEAKKKQQTVDVKEVQLSCRIDTHDFQTKANNAIRFLKSGDKVRVVLSFKGREMAHTEVGVEIIGKFIDLCSEYGNTDKAPTLDGRRMSVTISPVKK